MINTPVPIQVPESPASGWDLHCHTVYSDGTKTPAELVDEAYSLGLGGVGITDHDTTAGWNDAMASARKKNVGLLRGTEVTAHYGRISVHMLAYLYDPTNSRVSSMFAVTREARLTRAKAMVERLAQDYPITWDSVLEQVKKGEETTIGRPHMADALVAAGVYKTRSQAFAGAISPSRKYYLPTASPSALEVVEAVSAAGGVSVVAHPGDWSRNKTLLSDEQIERLAQAGLSGLEVWHRGNDGTQRFRLLSLAKRLGLLVTGGSDWHGAGKPNRLGECLTDDATVRQIAERGAIAAWMPEA